MKTLSFSFALTLIVFLGACTIGGSKPATELPTESLEPAPAPIIEPPDEAYPGSDTASDLGVVTSQAYPAQVDLSQLTPQPMEEAYPIEAPLPGVSDPLTAVAHRASQDLAQRLNVDISNVTITSAEEMQWSDSSLGCPSPDMVYAAVITPGYQIILEASGEAYDYHTDTQGNFILCGDNGQPVTP